MPNKNYAAGANFERRMLKKLEKDGATKTVRHPGSKGIVDIEWSDKVGARHHAQCKFSSVKPMASITPQELDNIHKYARENPGITVWLISKGKGTKETWRWIEPNA